jgi:hypothetical protein
MIALLGRFFSLDRPDRRLVLEAASLMAFVSIGLRLISFSNLRRILDHYISWSTKGNAGQVSPTAIGAVGWAIGAVAGHVPSATCLVQALAADAMLRRRRVPSEMCLGVRVRPDRAVAIEGHAWVECDGAVAVGGIDNISDFKVLTPPRSR